ncbi:MAG TPA: flavoprotein [Pirellulaceae bacterium]|nr:flavoprotein [Pirellulaceae bacterium]
MLVSVTGAVGAVAMPQYVLQFRQSLAVNVQVVMTKSARRFVTAYALRLLSGRRVITTMFDEGGGLLVPHIELARWADLHLIAPASASTISKASGGAGNDLVSLLCLSCKCPTVFAPSMNGAMWANTLVQRNIERLADAGYYFIEPQQGLEVAGMEPTLGVMPPPDVIIKYIKALPEKAGS